MSDETARAVKAWDPDEVLLLPLYPQFSTTTTGSSIAAWDEGRRAGPGSTVPTTTLCCWHSDGGFAAATAALVREAWHKARAELPAEVPLRILFSAHGLPESIVQPATPTSGRSSRPSPRWSRGSASRGWTTSSATSPA